jgi:DNA polymerase-3 subunit delta
MLYLLAGENIYKSYQRLKELQSEFKQQIDGEISIFNADEIEGIDTILTDADSLSLFSNQKLLIIKRLQSSGRDFEERICEYIQNSKDRNIILWEDRPIDKRKKIYKLMKRKGVIEDFQNIPYIQLKTWLNNLLSKYFTFDRECVDLLIYKVGEDQRQLIQAVRNLALLLKSEKKANLTTRDIDRFVLKTTEESIWDFIDAVGEQDKKNALLIIEELLYEKSDFVMIIGMLTRQFRLLTQVVYLLKKGKSYADISKLLRLHPFVLRKTISHSKNFSLEKLKKLYQKLVKTDLVVKEGRFEERLALDLFIAAT